NGHIKFNLTIPLQQLNGLETLVIIMVAIKYAFLQITRRRFLNEWEAFKKANLTSKEAKMGKVMRHTLGASLNIRHNLSSSKGPKPLQLKLLTTYIPKTSAFTLAFSTSQRLRTTRASARTFFTFRHYITPSARNF